MIDPFAPAYVRDPYAIYEEARETGRVFYNPDYDQWFLTRYEDIEAALLDPETFEASNAVDPVLPLAPEASAILAEGYHQIRVTANCNPPAHRRYRRHLAKTLSARKVAALEPRVRELSGRLIDAFAGRGRAELIREYAFPLPALTVFSLLGLPEEDADLLKGWSDDRADLINGATPERQADVARNVVSFWQYLEDFVDERSRHPGPDLVSELLAAGDGKDRLTKREVASLAMSLAFAGHETTTNSLGNGFRHVLARREVWAELCSEPRSIERAVEEIIRFDTPSPTLRRRTTRPVRVGDAEIPAGASVTLLLASANRDTAFGRPADFDPHRTDAGDHLSFGKGIHYCIGAPLARLELRVALEDWRRRFPTLDLDPDATIEFVPSFMFRGVRALHVRWR
jgi:cytochrome P450